MGHYGCYLLFLRGTKLFTVLYRLLSYIGIAVINLFDLDIGLLLTSLFVFLLTGSTKEEMADPSQPSEGAELSLRAQGRKSIGEPYIAHDLRL